MVKRPLCTAAVFFLCIQAVLTGWFHKAEDLKPTRLETAIGTEEQVTLEGTVYRREKKPEYNVVYLKDNSVQLNKQIYQESKILVYIETENHISIGNRVRLTGKAKTIQAARNPGNFNQKFYYQKMGIHVSVWAKTIKITNQKVYQIREKLTIFRIKWKALLIKCLGEYYGNIMSAILLGDKSELDSEISELYKKTGISHILAVSGLHMTFLGSGLYRILRKTGLPFLPAGGIGILVLTLYTLMIGCGVSSLRALTMFLVRMGADITGRDYDMPTSLALAGAVIIAWQPLYIVDAGFLLSFGAILGIICVAPGIRYCVQKGGERKKLVESLCASLGVNVVLLPVMLHFYFEFPPYSIFLNLFIIPFMPLVLGAGVIGSAICIVWPKVGSVLLLISKWTLMFYENACRGSMKLPGNRIVMGQPEKWGVVLYYMVTLIFCVCIHVYKSKLKRGRLILSCGTLLFLSGILFISSPTSFHKKEIEVTMVDVGQGDGIYLRGASGKSYFIDGGSSDVSSVGKYRIEPFLKAKGVGELECVFISHGDADHMNGIEEMLENQTFGIRIKKIVLPAKEVWDESLQALAEKAKRNKTKVYEIQEGDVIQDGKLTLTCEAPTYHYSGEKGNGASMVLSLAYGEFDMLFTGDVEGEGERQLEGKELSKYDILKVAHHGSKNSGSHVFLDQVSPDMAWISAGVKNRYGHPHPETIQKLQERDCQIFNTQTGGAVTLYTDGKQIQIKTYLECD